MNVSPTAPGPAADEAASATRWGHVEGRHLALAAAGCVGLAVVGLVDPARTTLGPPCPLQVTTGLDCPLCGATRATHQLVRGDVVAALDLNALYVLVVPVAVALMAWWLVRGELPTWTGRTGVRIGAGVVAASFFVARNLPWAPLELLGT